MKKNTMDKTVFSKNPQYFFYRRYAAFNSISWNHGIFNMSFKRLLICCFSSMVFWNARYFLGVATVFLSESAIHGIFFQATAFLEKSSLGMDLVLNFSALYVDSTIFFSFAVTVFFWWSHGIFKFRVTVFCFPSHGILFQATFRIRVFFSTPLT